MTASPAGAPRERENRGHEAEGQSCGCDGGGFRDRPGDRVEVQIKNSSQNTYWDGSSWAPASTWISASGTDSWSYALPSLDNATYEVKAMVAATVQTYGRLDIVVNNAAYMHDSRERSSVTGTTEEEWDLSMGVTLDGVFRVSKYALPEMIKGGGGAIVNVASIVAAVVVPNLAAYCTAKAGLVMFGKTLAMDLAPYNIRVNAICPGIIDTPLFRSRAGGPRPTAISAEQDDP